MSEIINKMGGIRFFGVVSICLFVAVFSTAMIWSLFLKRNFLKHMETLPLDEDNSSDKKL